MNVAFRFLLFISSYFPAFVVIAVLFWFEERWVAYGALALGFVGLGSFLLWLRVLRRKVDPDIETVSECRRNDTEAMTYVLSYLVPFVGGILRGQQAAIAFGIFFLVIGILYANSNMVHINPMLNIFGYRIYEAKLGPNTYVLVTRKHILAGNSVSVVPIGQEILLETR